MRRHIHSTFGTIMVLAILFLESGLFAQGSLMVNPKRIMLDDKKRSDVLTLYNNGDDTSSYSISFKHYEMKPDGSFKDVDTAKTAVLFCDSIVRYFPFEVTLAPHESQTVKIRFLKPKDLALGEYRSHLYFHPIERAKALEAQARDTAQKTVTLELHAIFGLAVPIIVRNQTTPAKVSMDNLKLSPLDTGGKVTLSAEIHRSGDESCYGSLLVKYKDKDGKETELSTVKGIAVYVPLLMRKVELRFAPPANMLTNGGSIKLEFQSLTDNPKETTLGSAELPLKKG